MWYVYIVKCVDGSLYTGIARDVASRLAQHNDGTGAKYTRSRRPVRLVYSERAPDRSAAQQREHGIKNLTAASKRMLIAAAAENR